MLSTIFIIVMSIYIKNIFKIILLTLVVIEGRLLPHEEERVPVVFEVNI